MAQSPRRVDLRLTIPAAAPYDAVAAELAGKFAEYAGAGANAAADLARELEVTLTAVVEATPDAAVQLDMLVGERELVVTLKAGATKTMTCPLPD